ncbi:MAG: AAA family ATPase, partial [Acidobacteria bacterium]|nr:AAA family ATPase [Acidobacteriota bacterium]
MPPKPPLCFPPFQLDLTTERLWSGGNPVPLRPKTWAVLRYLVERAPRLVTPAELLKAVFQRRYVSEGLLRGYVRDLRRVLEDDPKAPRFIETVPRRGYRFIAPLTPTPPLLSPMPCGVPHPPPARFVGRVQELAQLHGALQRMLGGKRQVVWVTGEPGIGKSTVVEAFLAQVAETHNLWIGVGQCIEHYGAGEAYLPVLEALGRLGRRAEGAPLIQLLRRQAPSWLVQMPSLIDEAELEVLSRRVYGTTQERMARELAEALEALTADWPLVLWLEDLHWSDYSTVELLAMLARRREPARLLVVGSYRPAQVIVSGHPLRALVRELPGHGQCEELALGCLTLPDVISYLAARLALG